VVASRADDHPEASHEFLDFCRAEQRLGREPYGRWVRLVPPISGSATPLYQEPFHDISFKPAHRYQAAAWLAYTAGYATRTSAGAWSPEAPLGSAGKLDDRGSAGA